MSEWHHGYEAGDILRAVVRAFEEAADSRAYLPDFPEFTARTEWLRATSRLVEEIANREPDWIDPLKRRKSWLCHRLNSASA